MLFAALFAGLKSGKILAHLLLIGNKLLRNTTYISQFARTASICCFSALYSCSVGCDVDAGGALCEAAVFSVAVLVEPWCSHGCSAGSPEDLEKPYRPDPKIVNAILPDGSTCGTVSSDISFAGGGAAT